MTNQQHTHARTQFNAASGTTPANIYNPPRPPEVYTLPDSVNDALYEQIRQNFQQDSAGRVLFFAGPPLDRPINRVSPRHEGAGHSVKYLAGRNGWLADREMKRRRRNTSPDATSKRRPVTASLDTGVVEDATAAEAMSGMSEWLHAFDDNAFEWQKKAGLEGWRIPTTK